MTEFNFIRFAWFQFKSKQSQARIKASETGVESEQTGCEMNNEEGTFVFSVMGIIIVVDCWVPRTGEMVQIVSK